MRRMRLLAPALLFLLFLAARPFTESESPHLRPGAGTRLHAHNCYPQSGRWPDRLDRALSTPSRPVAIEQDLVWRAGSAGGQSVVAHDAELAAAAPTLEEHFFVPMAAVLDRALEEGHTDRWPIVILHLDVKTNEPAHHRAIAALLEKYQRWLTTTERVSDDTRVMPLMPGPLLALTESGSGQEEEFHLRVPVGSRLRIFGTVPSSPVATSQTREEHEAALVRTSVGELIPHGATNYRRWSNLSWAVVEEGGPSGAGEWTRSDDARLRAIVARAHGIGLWIRFYALNGHPAAQHSGWSPSYNFGSAAAARERWQAAIAAGVDFVATDQYEDFAAMLARSPE